MATAGRGFQGSTITSLFGMETAELPKLKPELRPIVGRHEKPVPELMEIPKEITDKLLSLAGRINRMGHMGILSAEGGVTSYGDKYPKTPTLNKAFIRLAVHEQWRKFAPERFLKLCTQVGTTSKRGNTLYQIEQEVPTYHRVSETKKFTRYFVSYTCPSTGRLYVSEVPRESFRENGFRVGTTARLLEGIARDFDREVRVLDSNKHYVVVELRRHGRIETVGHVLQEVLEPQKEVRSPYHRADRAMAWKLGLTPKEYVKELKVEA